MRTNQVENNNAEDNNNYNINNPDARRRNRHANRPAPYPSLNRSFNNHHTSSLATFSTSNALSLGPSTSSLSSVPIFEKTLTPTQLIEPTLIFPLGSESPDDLGFPNHVLHYSVSPSARFAYVVGQELDGRTNLYVWDLYKGIRRTYKYSDMSFLRHFYAINDCYGFVVSSSSVLDKFTIFHVRIDHNACRISSMQHITSYTARGHVQFWSSCRYKNRGLVFALIDEVGVFIFKTELGAPLPEGGHEKLERSIFIDRNRLSNHYFIGQPFVHDEHVMFLEREYYNLKFTGRVVRIGLDDGKIESIETNLAERCTLFANELMNGLRMPNRIKHVERNGQLWAIMESSLPANASLFSNSPLNRTPQQRKFISVLCMKTWAWREVRLDVEASYDEMSLDVTSSGTVVIIKRGTCLNTSVICGFYYVQTRNPKSLMCSSFHQLISQHEELRFLDRKQLRAIGVADELL